MVDGRIELHSYYLYFILVTNALLFMSYYHHHIQFFPFYLWPHFYLSSLA